MTQPRCVPLITTGHCGSSLIMQILVDFGFQSPKGPVDDRHPCGHYDEPELHSPQIHENWDEFEAAIQSHKQLSRWAFKAVSGFICWPRRTLELLPDPRPVVLLRRNGQSVNVRAGKHGDERWYDWFMRGLPDALATIGDWPLLAFTWEDFLNDPQPLIERLHLHTVGTFPREAVVRKALERVK